MTQETPSKLKWLTALYAANIAWAGVPGLLLVAFPEFSKQNLLPYMFGDQPQDPATVGLLGSIWLAVGVISALGLRNPLAFAGVLPIQVVYKCIWITAVALPALARGDARVLPLTLLFLVIIAGALRATPYASMFTSRPSLHPVEAS